MHDRKISWQRKRSHPDGFRWQTLFCCSPVISTHCRDILSVCLNLKAFYVFAGSELLKCTLLAGIDGHLQYPPIAIPPQMVDGVGHQSPDLAVWAAHLYVCWNIIPSTSSWIWLNLTLPECDRPLRYLGTRPRPDIIRVRIRAASANLASRLQGILSTLSRLSCNVFPNLC
jgi:hypothetical protein